MPRLEERDYTYFTTVRGMCRSCRNVTPARVFFRGGHVWQESLCPACKNTPAMIASDTDWYLGNVPRPVPDRAPLKGSTPPVRGCPHDCGPCTWHASPCQLPVVSITSACNLECPICFTYNRNRDAFHITLEDMRRTVDWIVQSSGPVDLINVTGGEPTLHPRILDILECCKRPEIGRVTMNSNGLILAEDNALCDKLAQLGVYVILSFNTFDTQASVQIHGRDVVAAKLKAIDNLTRAGVKMTLLNVMIRGVNEDASGGILELVRQNDNILSLTVQTMTHTGPGGGKWPNRGHIPVDEAARIVCERSGGDLEFSDFLTRPSAHPLCYLACYAFKSGRKLLPFAKFAPREKIQAMMADSYLLRLSHDEHFLKDVINDLYSRGQTEHLKLFRNLFDRLFPAGRAPGAFERQRIAEAAVRTVYIHAHMDEDTFDCSRAMMCPDLVPSDPGKLVPACTYNLFHRAKDRRFHVDE